MQSSLIPFGARISLFDDFRKEMDDVLSRFFDGGERRGDLLQVSTWSPRLNLSESDTQYDVWVDLPGVKPEQVNLELRHGDLWITGERKCDFEEKDTTWHRIEQCYGQFQRVVRLGDDVDADHVDAKYKDGMLHITVPKAETAKTKRIDIKC